MKKTDLYYTAGLIDGEGTITLTRNNKGKQRSPAVSVASTTQELMEYLKETFGGHIITKKIYKKHHKPSWSWQLSYNAAFGFIKDIAPYLKEPEKKRRALLIIDQYKKVTPRNGKYTEELLEARNEFEEAFFKNP